MIMTVSLVWTVRYNTQGAAVCHLFRLVWDQTCLEAIYRWNRSLRGFVRLFECLESPSPATGPKNLLELDI